MALRKQWPFGLRTANRVLNRFSSPWNIWVMADCVTRCLRAVVVKLLVSTKSQNTRKVSISMMTAAYTKK